MVVVASTLAADAVPVPVVLPMVPIVIGVPLPRWMPIALSSDSPDASPVTAVAFVAESTAEAVPVTLPALPMEISTSLLMPLAAREVSAKAPPALGPLLGTPVLVLAVAVPVRLALPATLPSVPTVILLSWMPMPFCAASATAFPVTEAAEAATLPVASATTLPFAPIDTGALLRPNTLAVPVSLPSSPA